MEKFRIFLTGVTGFIGNALAKSLIEEGHEIHAIIRYKAAEDYRENPDRIEGVNYYVCNLIDHIHLQDLLVMIKPEIILHLAALSPVRHSFVSPIEYQHVNYLSTVNLVHFCIQLPSLIKFIFASTMETYGWQNEHKPFTENLPLNPVSPYAVSKVAAEKYIQMAGKAYNFPHVIMKPCNTFGRRQSKEFIIEYLITKMLENEAPSVGSPDAVRDMMYVSDHVNAYLSAIESDVIQGTYNFGNGLLYTMFELAKIIKQKIGYCGEILKGFPSDYPNRPVVDPFLSLNSKKAEKDLGWAPKITLDQGLTLSIQYWSEKLESF